MRYDGSLAEMTPVDAEGWFALPPLPNTGYTLRVVTAAGDELPLAPESQSDVAPASPEREYRLLLAADAAVTTEAPEQAIATNQTASTTPVVDNARVAPPLPAVANGPTAATIRGRVTSAVTGQPLRSVSVALLTAATGSPVSFAQSGQDGNYTLNVFSAGSYKITFEPSSFVTPGYLPEFYNNKTTLQSADVITVTDNAALTGIDAALERSGSITGRVTSATTGQPLGVGTVSIRAYTALTATTASQVAAPNAQGVYTLTNLAPGAYYLEFSSFTYITEFYNNQQRLLDATPIAVTNNATVTGIDAALDSHGVLAGSVTDGVNGATIPGVNLALYRKADRRFVANTDSDAAGRYAFPRLLPDLYILQVTDVPGYLDQYHNQQRTAATATPITTTVNVTTPLDITLARESLIRGRVTDAESGAPIPNVTVRAASLLTRTLDEFAQSDANGVYTVTALWSGVYTVTFTPPNTTEYSTEYYNNKPVATQADQVTVPASGVVTGIDAALEKLARLTGRVTGADTGAPLAGVTVTLYRLDNCVQRLFVDTEETDANGDYRFIRLEAGTYQVHFKPGFRATPAVKRYLEQYYNNKATEPGDPVTVNAQATTANINAALQPGGLIRGRVTAADTGLPLDDVFVDFYQQRGDLWYYVDDANVDVNGDYVSPALPPGTYRVNFDPSSFGEAAGYIEEYYNNNLTFATADAVTLATGADLGGIDGALDRGGQISGVVRDAVTGQPLDDVWADVYSADGKTYLTYGSVDSRGVYTTGAVPAGAYVVQFDPFSSGDAYSYTVSYYNNKPDITSADRVPVTATQITRNINGFLTLGGEIHGRVTAQNSGWPLDDVVVWARKIDNNESRYAFTDEDGYYKLGGLATGNYKVQFYSATYSDYCGRIDYSELYYNQKPTYETADPVPVTVRTITPNINGALPVKSVTGDPQPGDNFTERVYLPLLRR
jgi:5-hydroxyisourate hydrolase-like protein (transthyretin family)